MKNIHNWDVCPKWVKFSNRSSPKQMNNNTWDVVPEWVRFSHNPPTSHQKHVHEFEGSTKLAEENDERHNHRFAGVTGEAIPLPHCNHFHKIDTNTDFFDHFHEIEVKTGPAIYVGNGKHVHFVMGKTTVNDDHSHKFQFATLIESPLLSKHEC